MLNKSYNVSVNILRDSNKEINYFRTPNSERVIKQITNDFKKGVRAFTIIGSYGSGKSSLLWAFQQSLVNKRTDLFDIKLVDNSTIQFINIVGEYRSITSFFLERFGLEDSQKDINSVFQTIYEEYEAKTKSGKAPLFVFMIDEFGKFLEYASKHNPEKELYFIQQLAEFINNNNYNFCLITTIHQNFDAYSVGLDDIQKQEWFKVRGRFRELTFNEPIEQLLFLASQQLNNATNFKSSNTVFEALKIAEATKSFRFDKKFIDDIAIKIYPLDLLSANSITLCLQRYGQNERSLFSFLESTDKTGISDFTPSKNDPFYHVALVYDFIVYNYYSFIYSKENREYASWSAIRIALEKIEGLFDDNLESYNKIIKTIGLLSITTSKGAILLDDFLERYAEICLGISDASTLIRNLIQKKIIANRKYNRRYVLLDGTDLDFDAALEEAGRHLDEITDVTTLLRRYYQIPPILAKMYSFQIGTPRLFNFKISTFPIHEVPKNEYDGFINLVFNSSIKVKDIITESSLEKEAIIYGFYKNVTKIKEELFEILKVEKVIEKHYDDKVAVNELQTLKVHHEKQLNDLILESLFKNDVVWIFKGVEREIFNRKDFNKFLSHISKEVYPNTPIFKNELINKHKISPTINTARKDYFNQIASKWNLPNLGFESSKFPAHKTIYLTLLKENGVRLFSEDNLFVSEVSKDSSFRAVWDFCNAFLYKTRNGQRRIVELVELLSQKPFKLKQGLIDIWIPTYFFIRRNDFALFGDGVYLPNLTNEIMDLISKAPHRYEIKAFDLDGVKVDLFNRYRTLINQNVGQKINNQSFIETIKPFLVFYGELTPYAKNTKRLYNETISFREAIANAKDPEKTFFEDFPNALGYNIDTLQASEDNLEDYSRKLQDSIKELRNCYIELINRFENFIIEDYIGENIPFEEYRFKLQSRYKNLKKALLLTAQKTFIQRLDSPIDDRGIWLSSLAQALTGKSLEAFRDADEILLYDRFKRMVLDLDKLSVISETDYNPDIENVVGLEISTLVDGIKKSLIRFPKNKNLQVTKIEKNIKEQLSGNKSIDIVALTNLLNNLLTNE